jgi:hypothetical protein
MRNRRKPFGTVLVLFAAFAVAGAMFLNGIVPLGRAAADNRSRSSGSGRDNAATQQNAAIDERAVAERLGSTGVYFEENRGQQHEKVRYMTRGSGGTMFLTATEAVYVVMSRERGAESGEERNSKDESRNTKDESLNSIFEIRDSKFGRGPNSDVPRMATAVYMTLAGANQNAEFVPSERLEHNTNYFKGSDPDKWRTDIPNYGRITVNGIYPGIDAVWFGRDSGVRYDFVVSPGADPNQIEWEVRGATNVTVDAEGGLVIETPTGTLRQNKPYTFQETNGQRSEVQSSFRISQAESNTFRVGFNLGSYDTSKQLTIDPSVNLSNMSYSTFLGGGATDFGFSITVDGSGRAYVTGGTYSVGFPTTSGIFDPTHNGSEDVFVTKLNAAGSGLLYSTFLGGSSDDSGYDIKVDGAGNAFVTGLTASTAFPTTSGAYDTTHNGLFDAFVTKLNAAGSALLYSTFIGGDSFEEGNGIAIDNSGNAFVTGRTNSTNYPTTAGAYNTTYNGGVDVFVTKLNAAGSALVYSTFIGGSDTERGQAITIDSAGNVYVTGYTESTNYPTTAGAYNTTYNGGYYDVFVTKLNAAGSGLVYSTYLGGSSDEEEGNGIAVDNAGNAYVTGFTDDADFPTTAGAFDTTNDGSGDVFVTKLNAAGSGLVYSTFAGGSAVDEALGIVIDSSGNAFVTGRTASPDFPTTTGAYDTTHGGIFDVFVMKLNAAGSGLLYSTYIGGTSSERAYGIAIDDAGNAFVAGYTEGSDYPTTAGAFDPSFNGGFSDVFVSKLGDFSISGRTVDGLGNPISGSTITLSGSSSDTFTTGSDGYFYFGDTVINGNYVVTPSKPGTTFAPSSGTVPDLNGNKAFVFVGTLASAPQVQFSATSYTGNEAQSAVITVTRTGDLSGTSSVDVVLTAGTATGGASCATPGVDYVYTGPVTLNFAASAASKSFSVSLCNDLINEGTETVNLSLINNVNADIGSPSTAVLNINDTASQFVNFSNIQVPTNGTALTYPSTINVTGGPLTVGSMRVTLFDVVHFSSEGLEVLLVGPGGVKYVLMADAGGTGSINGATLTFTDAASSVITTAPVTGNYLTTTCGTSGPFPAPAPAGPYVEPGCSVSRPTASTLSGAFGLTIANGTWSLYVRDDGTDPLAPEGLAGEIGGWGLELLPPTAAGVEVSGRVLTPDGRGLRNATVTMTDVNGVTRTAVTSSFGYYRFEGVPVGDTFVMTVNSRLYRFTPRLVNVKDTLTDVDFVGLE